MNPTDDTKTLSEAKTKRRWRQCWQKRPFGTEQEAGEALGRMVKKNRALGQAGRLHVSRVHGVTTTTSATRTQCQDAADIRPQLPSCMPPGQATDATQS